MKKFLVLSLLFSMAALAQPQIYSGPQPGEPLPPFKVIASSGPHAGREVDFISEYGNSTVVLIFAHYIDRNVYRILWPLDRYVTDQATADLKTLYVYLGPEKVEGERRMAQVVKSLSLEVPTAASVEGVEGPGAYGLNKDAGVTAIIAKGGKVVWNSAITQPSDAACREIIAQLVKMGFGGHVPTDADLAGVAAPNKPGMMAGGQAMNMRQARKAASDDPAQVEYTLAQAVGFRANGTVGKKVVQDLKAWAGDDDQRRKYVASRLATVLEGNLKPAVRTQLEALKAECAK